MENHRGPFFYHAAALLVLFAPWSVFLVGAIWSGLRSAKREATKELTPQVRAFRFLVCWFAAYLVFFSLAATKLPNYVLPLYPAIAILTARFLTRWRVAELQLPKWMMPTAVAGVFLTAVTVIAGLLIASGTVPVLPASARVFPGLAPWSAIGLVPLVAGVLLLVALKRNNREQFVRTMATSAVAFTALIAAFPALVMDEYKAPKSLVRDSGIANPARDVRVARLEWFQPSVVFYAQREVTELKSVEDVTKFLAVPTPGYLFIPAKTWEQVETKVAVPTRIIARHHDFLKNYEVLVVTNDTTAVAER
jgi:4-amino-4-deoxy-L-arabinose transferase-like glycosyltransferase